MAVDAEIQLAIGQMTTETKALFSDLLTKHTALEAAHKALQTQADALDSKLTERHVGGGGTGTDPAAEICNKLIEQRGDFDRFKRISFEVKSTLLSTGLTTPQPTAEIGTYDAFGYGQVRQLFRPVPADGASVFALEEGSNSSWVASPQVEGEDKAEVSADLSPRTLSIRTQAAWIRMSKQALDDVLGLEVYIRSRLLWALAKRVDSQVVSGDGTAENLRGITPVAVSFNTALLSAADGYDRASIIGAAVAQVSVAGFIPSFVLMNPIDAYRMRFQRDSTGQYVAIPTLPPIVETVSLAQNSFVVGDASRALIRVRQQAVIEMSENVGTDFIANKIVLRAEERMLLQILSNRAFVVGSLTTSPA